VRRAKGGYGGRELGRKGGRGNPLKAPGASFFIWLTFSYWRWVAFFIKLLKYLRTPRGWNQIKWWCREVDAPLPLVTVKAALDAFARLGMVRRERKGGIYALTEKGWQEVDDLERLLLEAINYKPKDSVKTMIISYVRRGWSGWKDSYEIAEEIGTSPIYVSRVLNRLVESGLLEKKREGKRGGKNLYRPVKER